jgi:hypothetical protein
LKERVKILESNPLLWKVEQKERTKFGSTFLKG